MKIANWLTANTKKLQDAQIPTPRLDCLVLLQDLLGKNKAFIISHPEIELESQQLNSLDRSIKIRANHTPLSYIRGKTEFYGREFIVNKNVLEPRPESETIIDVLKSIEPSSIIIDVGTGSGALAITANLELATPNIIGVDIDDQCLKIATENSKKLEANVTFRNSNLLSSISKEELKNAILLANLPYVPDSHRLNQAAQNEPKLAIFGGTDGLDLYRSLFEQIKSLNSYPNFIITESLPYQHNSLEEIANTYGFNLVKADDFIQVFTPAEKLRA